LLVIFQALGFAVRLLHQRLRLAWLRMRTRSRRQLSGPVDPYRSLGPLPRFELRIGEDVLESESFGGIIAQMRALGCSDDEIIEAAIVTHRTPRGGVVQRRVKAFWYHSEIARVGDSDVTLAAAARHTYGSPSAPTPRPYLD
jgi:hypothetical protein